MRFVGVVVSGTRSRGRAGLGARDHGRDVGEQLPGVVDDAVLDRVLHAADALGLAGAVVQAQRARAVEHLEVLERVLVGDHEIGEQPGTDDAHVDRQSARLVEALGAVQRRGADHLERVEAGLLEQLELLDVAEAVELVDVARVRAGGDAPALVLEVVHERHPDAVEVAPVDLVLGRPVEPVRAVRVPARLEELHQRRKRIRGMPVGIARPHQVAARGVDRHRRIEEDPARDELVDEVVPRLAAARVDLVPELGDLGEAVRLVVVVVVGRVGLHGVLGEERVEEAVEVLRPMQAEAGRVAHVHARQAGLREVGRRAQLELAGAADERLHDLGVFGEELQAVCALAGGPGHPLARLLRRGDRAAQPAVAVARSGVDDDPRRGDLVARAAPALAHRPVERAGGDAADGGDAMGQPELVDVFGVGRLAAPTGVDVAVDEARHHVEAGAVDFPRRPARPRVGPDRDSGIADRPDLDDAVAGDHDVHGPLRRGAGAVDDGDAAQDEPLVRPFTLPRGPVGAGSDGLRGGPDGERGEGDEERDRRERPLPGAPTSRQRTQGVAVQGHRGEPRSAYYSRRMSWPRFPPPAFAAALFAVALAVWPVARPHAQVAIVPTAPAAVPATPEAREEFLREADVIASKRLGKGVTNPWRLTLKRGDVVHDAAFQSVDKRKDEVKFRSGRTELNFRDYFGYNIAAYRLARAVGYDDLVPATVERRWNGQTGALSWWVDKKWDEDERQKAGVKPPDQVAWEKQLYVARIFTHLVDDTDRNLGNQLVTADFRLWLIDFSRAFRLERAPKNPGFLRRIERRFYHRLKTISDAELAAAVAGYVVGPERDALLARRTALVAHFDALVAQRGADAVLFDTPTPQEQP